MGMTKTLHCNFRPRTIPEFSTAGVTAGVMTAGTLPITGGTKRESILVHVGFSKSLFGVSSTKGLWFLDSFNHASKTAGLVFVELLDEVLGLLKDPGLTLEAGNGSSGAPASHESSDSSMCAVSHGHDAPDYTSNVFKKGQTLHTLPAKLRGKIKILQLSLLQSF